MKLQYSKFWRDKGYPWAQNIVTLTHRGFFWSDKIFEPKGYTGHNEWGEEWIASDGEIGSLFVDIPANPYLADDDSRKEIRMARLRAEKTRAQNRFWSD